MNRKNFISVVLTILFIFSAILSIQCAKESESPDSAPMLSDKANDQEESPSMKEDAPKKPTSGKAKKRRLKDSEKSDDSRDLQTHFYIPMDLARDRLLEYRVKLTYESIDLLKSRQELLDITAKYGFIKSSLSTTQTSLPYVNSEIHVRSNSLYDALIDLDKLGVLLSENISVTDHTEQMVLAQKKITRERIRIDRKNKAINRVAPAAKTWRERESSLERSEDSLDKSDHDKWKIKDSVTWAKIHIYLKGPDMPDRIEVPIYRNALVGAVNFLLGVVYILIVLLPFILIFGIIWWKRGWIKGIFSRKNKEKQ